MPTLKDVAKLLGLQSEHQMGSKLGMQMPISTVALIKKYEQLPPKASFKVVPISGTMPLTVQFSDESLGYVTARNWKFDDGEPVPIPTLPISIGSRKKSSRAAISIFWDVSSGTRH